MKFLFSALFAFILATSVYSQNNHTELYKNLIDTTENDSIKLQYLDSLFFATNPEENVFNEYRNNYISLSKKTGKLNNAANRVITLSETLIKTGQFKPAENSITYLLKDSLYLHDTIQAKLYRSIGEINFTKANYLKALLNYRRSAKIYQHLDDSLQLGKIKLRIGQTYSITEDFPTAITTLREAVNLFDKNRHQEYITMTRFEMIILYAMNAFYDKSKNERDKLLPVLLKNENYITAAGLMLNASNEYNRQKKYTEQKQSLDDALVYLDKNTDETPPSISQRNHLLLLIYNAYALYYLNNNNIARGKEFIDKAQSFNNDSFFSIYKGTLKYTQARYNEESGNIDSAIKDGEIFLKNALHMNNQDGIIEGELLLKRLFLKKKNYKEAHKHLANATNLKDSVNNIVKTNTYLYYQKLFEIEESEKKVIQQKADIELLEKDNESKKKLLMFSIGGLALLFSSIFLYRNRQHLKKEKNLQEEFSQQLLISQEEERKRISKDLHDGLGQSLLLIKNKIALNDENTKSMFNNALEEVRSISRALHPFQLEKFGITKAIENVIDDFDENSEIFISSNIDDISNILSPEQEVNLYRIVQESISNIIKHSQAQAARVEIEKRPKYIHLKIKDNGKGFDFSEKNNDFNSLGLKTLKERTRFLKGTMKVESEKNKGTSLEFIIPV
ncbi:ATP-binding protein [Abyssalbus ytuae]|uniref:histidine kinase n=1 Tax=Abyssalbus ytuae TaxID=2926907 RepID=A0A9E7D390_9FLAO|nr:sensor histidine kinase [Abyssalbus ytuae]UOB19043.1 sensor histidine kinase [Abyssalbus ytuae]